VPAQRAACLQLLDDDKQPLSSLGALLAWDPALTTRLLSQLNAGREAAGRQEITSADTALNLIGEVRLRALLDSVPDLRDCVSDPATAQLYLKLIDRGRHTAFQADSLLRLRGVRLSPDWRLAALCYDLGEMALCAHEPETYRRLSDRAETQGIAVAEASGCLLGFSPRAFGHALAEQAHLPGILRRQQQQPNPALDQGQTIALAAKIARLTEAGWYHEELTACLKELAEHLGMPLEDTYCRVQVDAIAAARQLVAFSGLPAAGRLIRPVVDSVHEKVADQTRHQRAAPKPVRPVEQRDPSAPASKAPVPLQNIPVPVQDAPVQDVSLAQPGIPYARIIEAVRRQTRRPDLSVYQMMALVLTGLNKGLGLDRVMFATLDPKGAVLAVRMLAGVGKESPLAGFNLSLSTPSLFKQLLDKNQSAWVTAEILEKNSGLFPPEIAHLLGTAGFLCTPLYAAEKPIGAIYADQGDWLGSLNAALYQAFKAVCRCAAEDFTQRSRPAANSLPGGCRVALANDGPLD
jgi:HD-like signal output (HDOD) protein